MSLGANKELKSDELKMKLLEMDDKETGEALIAKKSFFKQKGKKQKKQQKKQRSCYICNSTLHLRNECPERKEEATKAGKANNAFCASQAFLSQCTESTWYLDSGASSHMTPNGNILSKKTQ